VIIIFLIFSVLISDHMTTLSINSVNCFGEFGQLSINRLLRKLLHVVDICEFGIQPLCNVCMHCFYFFPKQFISHLEISVKLVSLVCDALLNDFKLVINDFEVLEVFFIRYHHILKGIDNTNWDVVPFVWAQHSQLVFQSAKLSLILEALWLSCIQLLPDPNDCLFSYSSI
jgi:hypothetical protein